MTTHRLTYRPPQPTSKENRGWCEKVVVIYNTVENTWLWVKDEKVAFAHPWSPFSRGFREWGRCSLVWLLRKDWVPLGEKEEQKRFGLSLSHFETVFNTCSVSFYSQDWNEDSWWSQKVAEHSTNTMAMGQHWDIVPTLGRFSGFFCWKIWFFSCVKRDGHYKSQSWTFPQPPRSSEPGKSPSPLREGWAALGAVFPAAGQLAGSTAPATGAGMCNSMSFFGNEVGGGYQS